MQLNTACRKRKQAFTLLELLVVISIVALLISLILPAMQQTRNVARAAQCMSNMRQYGPVYNAWFADNDFWMNREVRVDGLDMNNREDVRHVRNHTPNLLKRFGYFPERDDYHRDRTGSITRGIHACPSEEHLYSSDEWPHRPNTHWNPTPSRWNANAWYGSTYAYNRYLSHDMGRDWQFKPTKYMTTCPL